MPEQKLDLLQFASGQMAQARATAAEVMGSEICDSGPPGGPLHHVPNGFRCDVLPPDRASSANSAEDKIGRDSGSPGPAIDRAFHPVRHGNRSNVLPLPDQVGDNPVFLTDLKVVDLQPHQLGAPEAASDQNCQNSSIPLSFKRIGGCCPQQPTAFICCQPVPNPRSQSFGTLHSSYPRREFRAQEAGIRRLIGKPPNGGHPTVKSSRGQVSSAPG